MRYSRDSPATTDVFGGLTAEEGCFILDVDNSYYYHRYGTSSHNGGWSPANVPNEVETIVCDANLVVNGTQINAQSATVGDFTKSTETTTFPGRRYPKAMSVYFFKLEDNGDVVRDMVPAVQDGVVGFWDKKNETFYPPSGSGAPTVCSEERAAGQRLVWTGAAGDGKLSTPGNWEGNVAPVSWLADTLVFDTTEGAVTVENDVAGLAVGAVRMQGSADNAVTINGKELVLTTEVAWSNEVPVTVNAPLRHMNTGNKKATFRVYDHLTLNGPLNFQSTTSANVIGYRLAGDREYCTFNGDITGPETTLEMQGANSKQITYDFRGKLTLDCFRNGRNWGAMTTTLYNPSNEIAVATGTYQELLLTDDALHGAVFQCDGYYREMATVPFRLTSGKTYVFDRISETGTIWENSGKPYADVIPGTSATLPVSLVLRGTGDATSACSLGSFWNAHWQTGVVSSQTAYPLSLTWDPVGDFTQEFRNRFHLMTGDIIVKGGTLRSAGTNVFQNVKKITVCSGATLDVASTNALMATFPSLQILTVEDGGTLKAGAGANPFPADSVAVMLFGDAKIDVDPSATLNIGRLAVNDTEVDPDDYTEAAWMTGGGTVTVSGKVSDSFRAWWLPVSGDWNDATKWLGGVPTSGSTVWMCNRGDYVVTFAVGDAVPKSVTGMGDGAFTAVVRPSGDVTWAEPTFTVGEGVRYEVPANATWTWNKTKKVSVSGGELRVDGGVLSITNNGVTVDITGTLSQTGRLTVAAGELRHSGTSVNGHIAVSAFGRCEISGGCVRQFPQVTGARAFSTFGGEVRMSGEASIEGNSTLDAQISYGTGSTVYSGNSKYYVRKSSSSITVTPGAAGETAYLGLKDHAGFTTGSFDGFYIGTTAGGKAIFEIDTDASQCMYSYRSAIGSDNGNGELILRKGYIWSDYRGMIVGVTSGNVYSKGVTALGGHGIVRVAGGSLYIKGSTAVGSECIFNGLLVGEASMTKATNPTGDGIQRGEFYLSDGVVTNGTGVLLVGGARSIGTFEQTGGVFIHNSGNNNASLVMIGLSGGRGSYLMGGGVADIRNTVYVGGCLTNAITGAGYLSSYYPYPADRHDAEGLLTVTGGVMTCTKSFYVGADGTGTVAVVGREGALNITQNLVLSNTTETATAAVLTFALGADGVAPITVGGKVVNTSGTKIVVDVGDTQAKRKNRRLIRCANWEGPAITDVIFVGERAGEASLRSDALGLYVGLSNGWTIMVR